jgi:type F conjugative transfer system protein TrbI
MAIIPPWSRFKQIVFQNSAAVSIWIIVIALAGAFIYSRFFVQPSQEAKHQAPTTITSHRPGEATPTPDEQDIVNRKVAPMRSQTPSPERVLYERTNDTAKPASTPPPLAPETLSVIDGAPQPEATPPPAPGAPNPSPTVSADELAVQQLSRREPIRQFSDHSAAYGRLIKAKLINTVDSSSAATPIIALVQEDIWWNGNKIIPINSEIHGTSQPDVIRDRIAGNDEYVIVLRGDGYYENGTELIVKGKILDRDDADAADHMWGITDGSYGMKGEIKQSASDKEMQLFVATFLSTAAQGLQTTTNNGFYGTQVAPTAHNALLAGTSGVLNQYAEQMLQAIKKDTEFVRVAGGHPFYLYVTESLDPEDNRVGASEQAWFKRKRAREDEETDQALRRSITPEVNPLTEAIQSNVAVRTQSYYPGQSFQQPGGIQYPGYPPLTPGAERDPNAVYGPRAAQSLNTPQ